MDLNKIEKRIELKARASRVWRAITDYREFGEWFKVKLEGPFVPGQISRGQITYPGYEHITGKPALRRWNPNGSFPSPGLTPDPSKRPTSRPTIPRPLAPLWNSGWNQLQAVHC